MGVGYRCLTSGSLLSAKIWGLEVVIVVWPLVSVEDNWSYDMVERTMKYLVKTGIEEHVSLCVEMRWMG